MPLVVLLAGIVVVVVIVTASDLSDLPVQETSLYKAIKAVSAGWRRQDLGRSVSMSKPYTEIGDACNFLRSSSHSDSNRVACSIPKGVLYISNSKITPGNITFYYGGGADDITVSMGLQHIALPPLESVTNRVKTVYNARVLRSKVKFEDAQCPNGIIDGTLHVIGLRTGQNLFHAINDNIMGLFARIVLDFYLRGEYLKKPHHLVIAGPPQLRARGKEVHTQNQVRANKIFRSAINVFGDDGTMTSSTPLVPHFRLLKDDFKVGLRGGGSECYTRVIWGNGASLFYYPELNTLRSQTADLLREFTRIKFKPPLPSTFAPMSPSSSKSSGEKIRVVVFLRDPGSGRGMPGEQRIAEYLSKDTSLGVVSSWCCSHAHSNSTDSLMEQLSHSFHADVIIGVHGAALTNAVFAPKGVLLVELKTIYGYNLDLYAQVAASRNGALAHIDVRDYRLPKGMSKVDFSLLRRIGDSVWTWRSLRDGGNSSNLMVQSKADGVFMVGGFPPSDQGHPLGPPQKEVSSMLSDPGEGWEKYWALIRHKPEPVLSI